MLNSLYGKFGQNGRVFTEIGRCDPDDVKVWDEYDVDSGQLYRMRSFGGVTQEMKTESESQHSSPSISSHVTSHARMYLWHLITQAGVDNVYYCDTDSLTINQDGLDRLHGDLIGDDLGQLKIENSFSNMRIYGAKDYIFGTRKRIKGVRKNAIELESGHFVQDKFDKIKSMLRSGDLDTMQVTQQHKHLKRIYNKGIVTPSGRVQPIVIG
tara:strand:- start:425 stop:1057 length:633 start_codon:yes stop_codon:yes gene_type:complete